MKKTLSFFLLSLVIALPAAAQGPGELFQKAKEQVKTARWTEALQTLDALDAASREPGLEAQRKQLEPALAFYRAVSMANLDRTAEAQAQFQIYLTATPNASLDRGMYSKKTMDAFENARKTMAGPAGPVSGLPSLATAYRDFRPTDPFVTDPPTSRWADRSRRGRSGGSRGRPWRERGGPTQARPDRPWSCGRSRRRPWSFSSTCRGRARRSGSRSSRSGTAPAPRRCDRGWPSKRHGRT